MENKMESKEAIKLQIKHTSAYPTKNGTIMNVYEVLGTDDEKQSYVNWLETSAIKPENRYSPSGNPKYFSSECVSTGEIVFSNKRQSWVVSNLEQRAMLQAAKSASNLGQDMLAEEFVREVAREKILAIKRAFRSRSSVASTPTPAPVAENQEDSTFIP